MSTHTYVYMSNSMYHAVVTQMTVRPSQLITMSGSFGELPLLSFSDTLTVFLSISNSSSSTYPFPSLFLILLPLSLSLFLILLPLSLSLFLILLPLSLSLFLILLPLPIPLPLSFHSQIPTLPISFPLSFSSIDNTMSRITLNYTHPPTQRNGQITMHNMASSLLYRTECVCCY